MSHITLVKTDIVHPNEQEQSVLRRFLTGYIDGFNRNDKKAWRSFLKRLMGMEPGCLAAIEVRIPRSAPFHKRHMVIEQTIFDAQDRFSDFEMFRDWIKIGSAWVVWMPGPKGGIVPLPRSISYAKADQVEFEKYHAQVMAFLRGEHAAPYLWRHLGAKAHEMMDAVLAEFGE